MPVCVTVLDVRRKRHSVAQGRWRVGGWGGVGCGVGWGGELHVPPMTSDLRSSK